MSKSGPKPVLICILILQIILCVFVYLTCSFIRRRRQRHHHGFRSSTALQPAPLNYLTKRDFMPRGGGLDPDVVNSFPVIPCIALKDTATECRGLECAVCLSSFRDDQTLRFIPKCEHVFHPDCVDPWLRRNSTCPYCRADLGPGELQPDGPGSGLGNGVEPEPDSVVIVVVTENDDERYTLRLSDEVWREIMKENTIRRSEDCRSLLPGERCPPIGRHEEALSVSESA